MGYLWNNFDRLIKTKNHVIQRLHCELEAADVDHRRLQEAHIQMMDLIIGNSSHIIVNLCYRTIIIIINVYKGRYKQKSIDLHESFTSERNRVVSNEMSELNRIRKNLEQHCFQLQNITFGQDKRMESILMRTKIQNAVNTYSITYLVLDIFHIFVRYTRGDIKTRTIFFTENISEGRFLVALN